MKRKPILAGIAALALAGAPQPASAQDATSGAALTGTALAAYQSWPADQRSVYDAWPADYRAYYWTLTATQQRGWWRLTNEQRAMIFGMTPAQRIGAWQSIEAQMAAAVPQPPAREGGKQP